MGDAILLEYIRAMLGVASVISPLFSLFQYISFLFRKNYFPLSKVNFLNFEQATDFAMMGTYNYGRCYSVGIYKGTFPSYFGKIIISPLLLQIFSLIS